IVYWDPDGRQPALLPGDDLHTVHSMTFSDEAITRMRDFFVTNYGHPDPPGGQSGNTDPRFKFSCIGTLNHAVEALYDRDLWPGNGAASIDATQDFLTEHGMTLGEASVRYRWNRADQTATGRTSAWDTIVGLSNHDRGWSVYLVSVAHGFHSATVSFDNRDPD